MNTTNEGCSRFFVDFIVRPGFFFGIAIWTYGWMTNAFIHDNTILATPGFLLMLACFWGGFFVLFKQTHLIARGRAARLTRPWRAAALVAALLANGCLVRGFFEPDSVPSISRSVSVVCEGGTMPAAGAYRPGTDAHIVLLRGGLNFGGKFNAEWKPGSLEDVELVVCLGSSTNTLIETCRYSLGGTVERYRESQPVHLMIARTGDVLASKVLMASPSGCPEVKSGNGKKKLHGHVSNGLIEAWVLSVLSSPAHTPTPALTATPARTKTPTATPPPVDVTFDTIDNYPAGHLVTLVGRLAMTDSILCSSGECGLLLENPAQPSQTLIVFVPVGLEPDQMEPLPDPYTKSDIQVQLHDGTVAVVGYRLRVTGRVCSSALQEHCISDVIRIELFQLK